MIIAQGLSEHGEVILRTGTAGYEIIVDGQFLMSTSSGDSSVALIELGLAVISSKKSLKVLIGGLGLGFSLKTALAAANVTSLTVVELDAHIIEWHSRGLIPETAQIFKCEAARFNIRNQDFLEFITTSKEEFDLIALDIDNGPDWLSHETNSRLYTQNGLLEIQGRLNPDGVVTFWSASKSDALKEALENRFGNVTEHEVYDHNGEGKPISAYIYLAKT